METLETAQCLIAKKKGVDERKDKESIFMASISLGQ